MREKSLLKSKIIYLFKNILRRSDTFNIQKTRKEIRGYIGTLRKHARSNKFVHIHKYEFVDCIEITIGERK